MKFYRRRTVVLRPSGGGQPFEQKPIEVSATGIKIAYTISEI